MKKVIKIVFVIVVSLTIVGWLGLKDVFTPLQRDNIDKPIYTIGDLNYEKAISAGKKVVKFGPAFWGIYPGGLAFEDVSKAEAFFKAQKQKFSAVSSDWGIYKLSVDFKLDTVKNGELFYLNKSLFVSELKKKL
jgi:hypothetical protein